MFQLPRGSQLVDQLNQIYFQSESRERFQRFSVLPQANPPDGQTKRGQLH